MRYRFSDIDYQGRPLRAVVLNHEAPNSFRVMIAQTTRACNALVGRLLVYSLAPQLVLLVLLAVWLRRRVEGELRPLGELR